ncbi:MAG: hypothetical protein AABX13_05330 [Nanoarchaeota archaeon]
MVIGLEQQKEEKSLLTHTFSILNSSRSSFLFWSLGLLIFYTFLFGLWKIPLVGFGINRMSAVTITDYLFIILITGLAATFIILWKHERAQNVSSSSKWGALGGGFSAFLAGICPVCQSLGLLAFGTTFLNIPIGFLVPYLGTLKLFSLGLLGLAVYMKADSVYTKTCTACKISIEPIDKTISPFLFRSNWLLGTLSVLVLLLFTNQLLLPNAFTSYSLGGGGGTSSLGAFEYGAKITLKPMPLAAGEQPKLPGYQAKVKPIPTISELPQKPSTGDAVQDLLNNLVPTGTPWYGTAAGVSFDDPVGAQNAWQKGLGVQLAPAEQERWNRIVNSFTCDYCCGSPQRPTIITHCGCAHSRAAQGMAKWFVKNYGSQYSDEEIYGEMARWYALWYPKGTIERIIQESQL